jgi:hypothetical protein
VTGIVLQRLERTGSPTRTCPGTEDYRSPSAGKKSVEAKRALETHARHAGLPGQSAGGAAGCGTLSELIPPTSPGGPWTYALLHSFTGQHGDGCQPNGGLAITKDGSVYGTTNYGGANFFGTAFRYTP